MKGTRTLQFKLLVIFMAAIIIPVLLIMLSTTFYYRHLMTQETETLTESALVSMADNIKTYLDDLEKMTMAPYVSTNVIGAMQIRATQKFETLDTITQLKIHTALNTELPPYYKNLRKGILSALLIPNDLSVYVLSDTKSMNILPASAYDYTSREWYKKAVEADGGAVYIGRHPQDYFEKPGADSVFSVARLIRHPDSRRPLGVIMADANAEVISNIVNKVHFNVKSLTAIFDHEGQLIFSDSPVSEELQGQIRENRQVVNDKSHSYRFVSKTIEPSGWRMVVFFSYDEIKSKAVFMYFSGFMIALAGVGFTFILYLALTRSITQPFKEMKRVMKEVQKGNFNARFTPKRMDEIAELGLSLNHMISRIKELIDREYKAVLSKRDAEYRALQSQIRPHFLFNTLNGFIGLNRLEKREELEKAILALTGMLRYTLQQAEWTTVEEEFQLLTRYCEIQKLRFGERLEYDISYSEEAAKCKIPKLLIQPVVENAIIHGIEPLDTNGRVTVKADITVCGDKCRLRMMIEDNGVGFDAGKRGTSTGVGMSNVRERLSIAYTCANISIESKKGEGTRILIHIPLEGRES